MPQCKYFILLSQELTIDHDCGFRTYTTPPISQNHHRTSYGERKYYDPLLPVSHSLQKHKTEDFFIRAHRYVFQPRLTEWRGNYKVCGKRHACQWRSVYVCVTVCVCVCVCVWVGGGGWWGGGRGGGESLTTRLL